MNVSPNANTALYTRIMNRESGGLMHYRPGDDLHNHIMENEALYPGVIAAIAARLAQKGHIREMVAERKSKHLSPARMAKLMRVRLETLEEFERGERVNKPLMDRYAKALGRAR